MNRKLIVPLIIGIFALVIGVWVIFSAADKPALMTEVKDEDAMLTEQSEASDTETGSEEGLLKLDSEQIEAAGIELVPVSQGGGTTIVVPGTVEAQTSATAAVDARADGVVTSLTKTLGDFVRRGETVATLQSPQASSLTAQIAAAQAQVTQARSAQIREQRLFNANVTARQDLEAANTALAVAEAEVSRARAAARAAGVARDGNTVAVVSPISGQVTGIKAVLGSFVSAGTEMVHIIDPSRIQIEAALPASDAGRIKPGDRAAVSLEDGGQITGTVRSVTPSLDPESRSAVAVIRIEGNPAMLTPDSFVEVTLMPEAEAASADTFSVPEDAVQSIDGKTMVFVASEAGLRATEVRTGARAGGRVDVVEGLTVNMTVASKGAFRLKAELEKGEAEHGH